MVFAPTAECYGGLSQVMRRFREGLQGEYREGFGAGFPRRLEVAFREGLQGIVPGR